MRIVADGNVSGSVIRELRRKGHDALSVKEAMRSESDEAVLRRAQSEERVVLTHDKDFGELAFRWGLPATTGVILYRLQGRNPKSVNRRVLEVFESRPDWSGCFAVVTEDRVRMRPLSSIRQR
ncbi:MAG: DUF5615 family PIN-like protein [Planctomycetes bacterium]|nr:DUF5615 family PIN-like protein [Planctomycetota bacterium]